MAYFGRHPEKPGSVPGSQSGGREMRQGARAERLIRQVLRGRQVRPERFGKVVRSSRANRTGRSGR